MKKMLALWFCLLMICQMVMGGELIRGADAPSDGAWIEDSALDSSFEEAPGGDVFGDWQEASEPLDVPQGDIAEDLSQSTGNEENLFAAWEGENELGLETWDESEINEELSPADPELFSSGEGVLEENGEFQAEIAEEDQPQDTKGEWSFYTYYIDPLYQDVMTEDDLFSLPEGITQDALVGEDYQTFSDILSAGAYMRKNLVEHKEIISFREELSPELAEEFKNDKNETKKKDHILKIYKESIRHTKNPVEGDYLFRTCAGYRLYANDFLSSTSPSYLYLTFVYTYKTTLQQEAEITAMVNDIKSKWDFSGASEIEIIRTVYDYVCTEITYDYANYYTPVEFGLAGSGYTLVRKLAICDGFSTILYRLFLEAGIDSRVILGDENGGGGHAWNICKLGDKFYNVDSTWDCDLAIDGLPYKHFLIGRNFKRHIPYKKDYGSDFWASYPLSETDYTPEVSPSPTPELKSGTCGENLTWELNETGMLTINGKGEMYNYSYETQNENPATTAPWGTGIKRVYIYGCTKIGTHAFTGCDRLSYVYIGSQTAAIGYGAFYHCDTLMRVDFSRSTSLTEIQDCAFYHCPGLGDIELPSTVRKIGAFAFAFCDQLSKLKLSEELETIGEHAFEACKYLWSIDIPQGVTSIGKYAFGWCGAIPQIHLPDGLAQIEEGTFTGCIGLSQVTVPKNILSIGKFAFYDCQGLTSLIIEGKDTTLEEGAVKNCSALTLYGESGSKAEEYARAHQVPFGLLSEAHPLADSGKCGKDTVWSLTGDGTLYISGNGDMESYYDYESTASTTEERIKNRPWGTGIKNVIIGYGVSGIGEYAFYQCADLESVTFSDTVKVIKWAAFAGCSKLKSVTLPQSVTDLQNYTFQNCTSLTQVTLSDNILTISGGNFDGCSQLTQIKFPEKLEFLGNYVCKNCSALEKVEFPDGLSFIGGYSFDGCKLLTEVKLPGKLSYLGWGAFKHCANLTKIQMPDALEYLGVSAFWGCEKLESITLSKSLNYLGDSVFVFCKALKTIEIPEKIERINSQTFWGCSSLETVLLPDHLVEIGKAAFRYCPALKSLTIPASVKKIDDPLAFAGCNNLTLYGAKGSFIESYAAQNNLRFQIIEGTATPTPRPTNTATPTPRPTNTATPTPRPTNTATPTPRPTNTATPTPAPRITLNQSKVTLYADGTEKKSFQAFQLVASSNSNRQILFRSSNGTVAQVEETTGIIYPKKKGTAVITAYLSGQASVYARCTVKVKKPSVKFTPKKVSLKVGKQTTLTGTLVPAKGTAYTDWSDCKGIVSYEYRGSDIILKGLKKGKGYLRVLYGSVSKRVKITVK